MRQIMSFILTVIFSLTVFAASGPIVASKTVTTAGTQVQLSTTDLLVTAVFFEGLRGNTGFIYIGDADVSNALYIASVASAGSFGMSLGSGKGFKDPSALINLKNIWVDSSVNGEKVLWSYFLP
jgi:hypothetical protein